MTKIDRAVGWHSKDVARAAALVIGLYLLVQLVWYVNQLVLVAFLGVLFGLALEAGVDRLERHRIRRGAGAALIVVVFLAMLFGVGAWMTPIVREQGAELRARIPQAVDRIEQWLSRRRHGVFGFVFGGGGGGGGADTTDTTQLRARDTTAVARADSEAVAAGDSTREGRTAAPTATETLRSSLGKQVGS